MKIECREMTPEDRKTALDWIAEYYGKSFPEDFLPESGLVCMMDDQEACMIPIYLEQSSSVMVLGHCILNQSMHRRVLAAAVRFCILESKRYAAMHHKKYIISLFGRNSINRIADDYGFVTADVAEEKFYFTGVKNG